MSVDSKSESTPFKTPTKQGNAATKDTVPLPGITLSLVKATNILGDTCNDKFTFQVHASIAFMLFGIKPKEDDSCTWHNLPVNWNETQIPCSIRNNCQLLRYSGDRFHREQASAKP